MAYEYQNFATLGVNLNRQKYGALDISSVFTSEADLGYYLSKGANKTGVSQYWLDIVPYPYAGQVIAKVINGEVNVYALKEKADGTFETTEIGGKVSVDDVTIVAAEDGTLSIKGYDAAQVNAQLVKTANGLAWVVPDNTTVEGLSTAVSTLQSDMSTAQGDIDALEEKVGDATSGLVKDVAALKTSVGSANDAANASGSVYARIAKNVSDISALEGKMSGVFHFKGAAPDGQLSNVTTKETGDVYTVSDKEYAWSGTEWVELGFTTDLSKYSTTEQMNTAISDAKSEANTYADGKASAAEQNAKDYADGLADNYAPKSLVTNVTTAEGEIDALQAKLAEIPADKTVKQYIDTQDSALGARIDTEKARIDGLGSLASKSSVAEDDLATALKNKINGKADKATTLAGYGIEDAPTKSEMTDALAGKANSSDLGTMAKEAAADYTKTADLETALKGKYDVAGAAAAVQGATTETVKTVADKVATAQSEIDTLKGTGVGSVDKKIETAINDLDLGNTYAAKEHTHAIADVTGLQGKLDEKANSADLGTMAKEKAADYTKTSGLATALANDFDAKGSASAVLGKESDADTAATVYGARKLAQKGVSDAETAKTAADNAQSAADDAADAASTADGKAVAAQNAVDTLSGKVGTVPANKTVVGMIAEAQTAATYDDTDVKAGIAANTEAIDVLNGSGVGSVDKKVNDAINKFATDVSSDGVVNSYKELIDWVAAHGSEATEMANAITAIQNILDGIGGEGEKATVVAYVADAINALKIGDYAKAADLTALATRVTTVEGKAHEHANKAELDKIATGDKAKWDAAEQNAKDYADGLAGNYDAKGSAATAETNAKSYCDTKLGDALAWGSF